MISTPPLYEEFKKLHHLTPYTRQILEAVHRANGSRFSMISPFLQSGLKCIRGEPQIFDVRSKVVVKV